MTLNQLKNQHLLWRAGFGPMAEQFHELQTPSQTTFVNALFKAAAKPPAYINVANTALDGLSKGIGDIARQNKDFTTEQKKKFREQSKQGIKSLNLYWLNEMVNSEQQLREKMALFWHGHFASRNLNVLYQQQLLHVIRMHALGNFSDLLHEVSKSAAMINFLNNNQNRKNHPNENFARELMELFTLGRGNYTEQDVKEAARAFTGWGANIAGEFVFRKFQHDAGSKTFLKRKGNFEGEDILNILLEEKQTAKFITGKIYRYFVNEKSDDAIVQALADRFYKNNYDIRQLMLDIFNSDWFYDSKNIGKRIKSPVELIVGIRRNLPMEIQNEEAHLLVQRLLGQLLFFPPNVAGWPGDKSWIDSSSLTLRMRLPQLIAGHDVLNYQPKQDDDQAMGRDEGMMQMKKTRLASITQTIIDWKQYTGEFKNVPRGDLIKSIASVLLQTQVDENIIEKYTDQSSRDEFIQSATIRIMSMPEYQLC